MKKILSIFGTRPEAIKMAPVVQKIVSNPELQSVICVTAQHREMLDQVLNLFDIVPQYDLNIMKEGQTLEYITSSVLMGLQPIIAKERPDLILVHGDTTTTFAGSLAGYYAQIPVAHVEAGLRTNNKFSPYPEEINRRLAGVLCDWHFSPTVLAKNNLMKENVPEKNIMVTGNTVIDALNTTVNKPYEFTDLKLNKLIKSGKRLIVMTTHRRENLGDPLRHVYLALKTCLNNHSDVAIVFPVHKNPAVRSVVNEVLGNDDRVLLMEPMDYQPFANLMKNAYIILTDSGGIQEEAPSLGKPVLVVRNTTERPEAVDAGTVKLTGTDYDKVLKELNMLLDEQMYYKVMAEAVNPYGDGRASERIISKILHILKLNNEVLDEFSYVRCK